MSSRWQKLKSLDGLSGLVGREVTMQMKQKWGHLPPPWNGQSPKQLMVGAGMSCVINSYTTPKLTHNNMAAMINLFQTTPLTLLKPLPK